MIAAHLAAVDAVVAGTGSPLWYLSRGTGVVTLVLLTLVVVLGVLSRRGGVPGTGSVVLAGVHRNASLLVVVLLVVHIATAVLDPYAPIRLVDAVVPFVSAYRPMWLGLGALAFDLVVALVVTSLVRVRLGLRWWRNIHWLAYLAWPVAVLHGAGTGTDTTSLWNLVTVAACVVSVVGAVLVRARMLDDGAPGRASGVRAAGLASAGLFVGWMVLGPLAPGWAARAGTPPAQPAGASTVASTGSTGSTSGTTGTLAPGSGTWTGTVVQSDGGNGEVLLVFTGPLSGGLRGHRLEMRLTGTPLTGGGINLSGGRVTLTASHGQWAGPVSALAGDRVEARLSGVPATVDGRMRITLNLSSDTSFTGTVVLQ